LYEVFYYIPIWDIRWQSISKLQASSKPCSFFPVLVTTRQYGSVTWKNTSLFTNKIIIKINNPESLGETFLCASNIHIYIYIYICVRACVYFTEPEFNLCVRKYTNFILCLNYFRCYTVHVVELQRSTECTSVAGHSSQHNITLHGMLPQHPTGTAKLMWLIKVWL